MDSVQKGESLEREHPGRAHRSVGPWWCLVGIMLQSGQIPSVDWEWRGPQSKASGQVHPPLWLLVSLWGKEMCGINRGTREEGGCVGLPCPAPAYMNPLPHPVQAVSGCLLAHLCDKELAALVLGKQPQVERLCLFLPA